MYLRAFIASGTSVSISATTASTANQLSTPAGANVYNNLRVVNESIATALVSVSTSTSPDATADAKTMAVLAGTERIFGWNPNFNTVGVALRTGTGIVQLELGNGF